MTRTAKALLCASLVLTIGILAACNKTEAGEVDSMIFMAGYRPQANLPFVGAYVAQEMGYFAAEGLEVDIQHSAGGGEHLQLLAAGEVQVTTQDAAVLLKRRADPGLPLVSIGLVGQKGQQAYAALADSGIQSPEDWKGATIGYKGTPAPDLFAIMQAVGIGVDDARLVNVGFDPRVLTEGQVDVYPVFKSNEPDLIRSWGYELRLWDAADYGVPTLGLTYVTSEEMIAQRPQTLEKFMHAVQRGIEYAKANRDAAVEIVLQYAGEDADRGHMRFMLDSELEDYDSPVTQANGPMWQSVEQWQQLEDMLLSNGAMTKGVDAAKVFTNQFLPQ